MASLEGPSAALHSAQDDRNLVAPLRHLLDARRQPPLFASPFTVRDNSASPPFTQCPPPTGNPPLEVPAVGGALFTPGAPEPVSGVLLLTGAQPAKLNPDPNASAANNM